MKRFEKLTSKTKAHLYKALILPMLEYPSIPNCIASPTNTLKMQRIQNKAIKFINRYSEDQLTIEESHIRYKLDPMNIRLHKRANKCWDRFCINQEELAERSRMASEERDNRDHFWWRRISPYVDSPQPEPVYVYQADS